ncbi:MAG: hypothetical protein LBD34_02015 [Puniceicoccales bacterium]|jgi:hypothetical protein|nr:hypothetical protein [Puniceicoccales bacterium]
MKTKKKIWLLAVASLMMFTIVSLSRCGGKDDPTPPDPTPPEPPITEGLPDSIKNGSDFYVISMDNVSQNVLGVKVKVPTMLRDYDVWPDGLPLEAGIYSGNNSFGEPYADPDVVWTAFVVTNYAVNATKWNGGAIVGEFKRTIGGVEVDMYPNGVPNLTEVTNNPNDYYFHFAIKSPTDQTDAGCVLLFFSDGTPTIDGDINEGGGLKYYFGPQGSVGSIVSKGVKLGNYEHNGEWQHIEIPVSRMVSDGYRWDGPIRVWSNKTEGATQNRPILLGFQQVRNIEGYEINLDAMFFYKKPAQ